MRRVRSVCNRADLGCVSRGSKFALVDDLFIRGVCGKMASFRAELKYQRNVFLVVTCCPLAALGDKVSFAQFSATARGYVFNTIDRIKALIHMVVAGEHDVDSLLGEDRLKELGQRFIGGVVFCRRMQGVMHCDNFPMGGASAQ